jgi:hypothetical protein
MALAPALLPELLLLLLRALAHRVLIVRLGWVLLL